MKIGRLFVVAILAMTFLIIFGDRGLVGFRESKEKLDSLKAENSLVADENDRLRGEILLLRSNMEYIETVARRELGMIREGETVYRFKER